MASQIGVVGMAVMGRNFAMNIAEKGFRTSVYNRTTARMEEAVEEAKKQNLEKTFIGYKDIKDFIASIEKPRKIVVLVQSGEPARQTIEQLLSLVDEQDIIIDAGNEHFKNSEERILLCNAKKVRFVPMGISGGEEGARHGPALMPGGSRETWELLRPILEAVAAKAPEDGAPCVNFIGAGAGGIYSKMVHNGIEYGDMQLIAEAYLLMKSICKFDNAKLADVFAQWNKGDLKSYLIEITSKILQMPDAESPTGSLVDVISDVAGSKGTGKWTCQEAGERGIPIPTIQAALDSRYLSGMTNFRSEMQALFAASVSETTTSDSSSALTSEEIGAALYCSKICSYAQGLSLLQTASDELNYGISIPEVAAVWRGGCIIQAAFLSVITDVYSKNPKLTNLAVAPYFADKIKLCMTSWRKVVATATLRGLAVPAFSASLAYFDALTAPRMPTCLIQAQRDFFGAHTFERTDKQTGVKFHADWTLVGSGKQGAVKESAATSK